MLTISKATSKNKAGVTLRKESNVLKYVRDRLEEMPLVGDLQMQLTDEQIIASVRSIGDKETDVLEFLANAARSANADNETDENEEGEEGEDDEGGSNIQDISAAAKGSSDLSFALAIADKLKGDDFTGFVEAYWHAVKTVADGVLDMRSLLLKMFGAKGLAEMPVVGSYSIAASKKTKKIVPLAGDNEHAHHFLVTEYRDGKNVDVPVNFFHAAADHCPIGQPLVTRIEQMNKARGKGKPDVEAPQSMIEEYRNEPAEFMSTLRTLEDRHKKLRSLFTDAVAVQQQLGRFKELPLVYVAFPKAKGTAPIMIGARTKNEETGELIPGIGTTYGVRQFLAFDVAKAIKDGGSLTNLLDTVKREPRSADTTTPSITVETANAFFGVLSALRTFTRKTDWEAGVLKGLAEDKEGANKTHVRFLGDVYLALAPMWETIKGRYQQDIDEENKQKEKDAQEKADKQKEYRANLARDMAAAHNAKQKGETVIIRKVS